MRILISVLVLICPMLTLANVLEGVAKNQKGDVLYLEKHVVEKDADGLNKFIRVEYSKPDGTIFATMTSDFKGNKTVPETVFEDKRFKLKSVIRIADGDVVFEETKNDKDVSKKKVPLHESMVASQGFDNFIKLNFQKLEANPVEFKFGVIDKKDFFTLTGYKRPTEESQVVEFGIKASSWLIRLFASELRVIYDAKDKRLKSFIGKSNILDDAGNPQDVVIEYKWKVSS